MALTEAAYLKSQEIQMTMITEMMKKTVAESNKEMVDKITEKVDTKIDDAMATLRK